MKNAEPIIARRSPVGDLRDFPNFLIIGPQRTGTTWLYHNLKTHPQILMPGIKEMYYFSTLGQPDHKHFRYPFLEDYLAEFRDSPRRRLKRHYDSFRYHGRLFQPKVRGEATATYARLSPAVIRQITELQPDIKAVLMVRDPVERGWSHAKKDLQRLGADLSSSSECLKFIQKSSQRELADYALISKHWGSALRKGNLFCGDYRMLAAQPVALLTKIATFLGVDPEPCERGRHLGERVNPTTEVPMPDGLREALEELFAEERLAAARLLGA